MTNELSYGKFNLEINDKIMESHKYDELKAQERDLSAQILKTTNEQKKLQNDFSREQDENTKEITSLKRDKNEAQVEKDLHIQYLERRIQGE